MDSFAIPPSRRRWSDLHTGLRAARKAIGLTQRDLADMLGVDQTSVSRWESGAQIPDGKLRHRLRDLLFRGRALSDARLKHMVRSSPCLAILMAPDGAFLAESEAALSVNAKADLANFHDASTPSLEAAWSAAQREGLFRGDIASLRVAVDWQSCAGESIYAQAIWHPATLADGSICLLGEATRIDEASYQRLRSMGLQITPIEEIF